MHIPWAVRGMYGVNIYRQVADTLLRTTGKVPVEL